MNRSEGSCGTTNAARRDVMSLLFSLNCLPMSRGLPRFVSWIHSSILPTTQGKVASNTCISPCNRCHHCYFGMALFWTLTP